MWYGLYMLLVSPYVIWIQLRFNLYLVRLIHGALP
jgi:hypothetical protein